MGPSNAKIGVRLLSHHRPTVSNRTPTNIAGGSFPLVYDQNLCNFKSVDSIKLAAEFCHLISAGQPQQRSIWFEYYSEPIHLKWETFGKVSGSFHPDEIHGFTFTTVLIKTMVERRDESVFRRWGCRMTISVAICDGYCIKSVFRVTMWRLAVFHFICDGFRASS